jgi:hypothetical protein
MVLIYAKSILFGLVMAVAATLLFIMPFVFVDAKQP